MKDSGDPSRLRFESDSPRELVRALELAQGELPGPDEIARIAARLGPLLAPGESDLGVVQERRAPASIRPRAAGGAVLVIQLLLAAVVAAAGLGTLWHFGGKSNEKAELPALASPTSVAAPSVKLSKPLLPAAPVQPSADAHTQTPTNAATGAVHATDALSGAARVVQHVPTSESTGDDVPVPSSAAFPDATGTMEMDLLGRAQRALATDPGLALRLTDEHARRFPSGLLAQEREFVAIQALLGLGRRTDADARAAQFRLLFPRSAHLRRLDLLLGRARDDGP